MHATGETASNKTMVLIVKVSFIKPSGNNRYRRYSITKLNSENWIHQSHQKQLMSKIFIKKASGC
jgi:hypothetical protein